MTSAMSSFDRSSWRYCIFKSFYPDALYQYKRRRTPDQFLDDKKLLAFRIDYDGSSQTTQLRPEPASSIEPVPATETIEFKDTIKYFKHTPEDNICGWYLRDGDRAKFEWDTLRTRMEKSGQEELNSTRKYREQFGIEAGCHGIEPLWAIRGYFIGPSTDWAPPYITVLCSHPKVSTWLVDSIRDRLGVWPGWGVTRLPKVQALEYVSRPGSPDQSINTSEVESPLEKIQVNLTDDHTIPTMTGKDLFSWTYQQHRCGVRLDITQGSRVVARGTIGGLIKIGDNLYGLTVAHIFPTLDAAISSTQDSRGSLINTATSRTHQKNDADRTATLNRWEKDQTRNMALDWALVDMPPLQKAISSANPWHDVNLVQTTSGDFRPVLVALSEPHRPTRIVLATPESTHCVGGQFVGSEAIVNIPGAPAPYSTWVLRMEQPWLIQPGDSGSWAFDAQSGDLLGVLVAGSPELQEAYIIPAYRIFEDIEYQCDSPVSLGNGYSVSREVRDDFDHCVRIQEGIGQEVLESRSPKDLQRLENRLATWIKQSSTIFTKGSEMTHKFRSPRPSWIDPIPILSLQYAKGGKPTRFDFGNTITMTDNEWCQNTLCQPPIQCYNALQEKISTLGNEIHQQYNSKEVAIIQSLWRHLLLGRTEFYFPNNEQSDVSAPASQRVIDDEIDLMKPDIYRRYSYTGLPRDRQTLRASMNMMEQHLKRQLLLRRKCFEASLPEIDLFESGPDEAMVLLAVVVLNKPKTRVSVIVPPGTIGPYTYNHNSLRWHSGIIDRLTNDNGNVEFSSFRLPFTLRDKALDEERNLTQLLKSQLQVEKSAFDKIGRLNGDARGFSFYLRGQSRYVDMVVYEAVLKEEEWQKGLSNSDGWPVVDVSPDEAKDYLVRPFSVAVQSSSAIQILKFKPKPQPPNIRLDGNTALVTGAGVVSLGPEAANEMTSRGLSRAILGVRDTTTSEEARQQIIGERCDVEVWHVDYESFETMTKFSVRAKSLDRLNIVMLCASVKNMKFIQSQTCHESSVQINHLGTSFLSLPLLGPFRNTAKKQCQPSRLKIATSETHFWTPFDERKAESILGRMNEEDRMKYGMERYNTSKLLNILWMRELSSKVESQHVVINAVNPGWCGTGLHRSDTIPGVRFMIRIFAWPPVKGGHCLTDAVTQHVDQHGIYLSEQRVESPSPFVLSPDGEATQKRLWQETIAILKQAQPIVEVESCL
ncbi:hypothetical protein FDECE_2367 [Fusarium decemcellulare]|nr:hypothetical protein FDECE_2367 [Fusarium decemcellulare]